MSSLQNPPRDGEVAAASAADGGAGWTVTGPMQTVLRARHLRRTMTLPEIILWRALKLRPAGLKFRKQHPAGDYVLDFYCAAARLAVEVDGQIHADSLQAEHDIRRDAWLAGRDVRVLRVPAQAVLRDVAAVEEMIVARVSPDQPLRQSPAATATSPCRGGAAL